MARTAGHGQANDEAPRTSFFQVTFDPLVVPVALRSPSRRIGHEDTSQGQAIAGSDPASGAPPPILIGGIGRGRSRLPGADIGYPAGVDDDCRSVPPSTAAARLRLC